MKRWRRIGGNLIVKVKLLSFGPFVVSFLEIILGCYEMGFRSHMEKNLSQCNCAFVLHVISFLYCERKKLNLVGVVLKWAQNLGFIYLFSLLGLVSFSFLFFREYESCYVW